MKDGQNNEIKVGVAYQYAFSYPGPDVTCVIVNGIYDDGTVDAYDVLFNLRMRIKGVNLIRPLSRTWESWDYMKDAVVKCGGSLDLNVDKAPQQEVKSALEIGMARYAGAMQNLAEGDK